MRLLTRKSSSGGVHRRPPGELGMTLIEIMIVVVIMASIATAVAVSVMKQKEIADYKLARIEVAAIGAAIDLSRLNGYRDCPTARWLIDEDYLRDCSPEDPWGTDYVIRCDGQDIDVYSAGPDGAEGTEDDIR